jgi:NADH dehydrogenase
LPWKIWSYLKLRKIVIVGGGAAGLELATFLGKSLGKKGKAEIILLDKERVHFWKPHLHELAAGSLNLENHSVDYLSLAYQNNFCYFTGDVIGIDRKRKKIRIGENCDDQGELLTPECEIDYDQLVLSVGSQINDFGTSGVKEHAVTLDSFAQAIKLQKKLVNSFLKANAQSNQKQELAGHQLQLVIVGGGATGVELAAELQNATKALVAFGYAALKDQGNIKITLVEANDRILKILPKRISDAARKILNDRGVSVLEEAKVSSILPNEVVLADGRKIPSEIVVWAAGIKCSSFLRKIGLEVNELNQILVRETLQSKNDDSIFAIGDCASCLWENGPQNFVPPRAQAASQQARHLAKELKIYTIERKFSPWIYKDFGSLISLGKYNTVGNLMASLDSKGMFFEGFFARFMYVSLYKIHEYALFGLRKMLVLNLGRIISSQSSTRIKLH